MVIQPIDQTTRAQVDAVIREEWHGPLSVSRGKVLDTSRLPGFVCVQDGRLLGCATVHIEDGACELVTLNSLEEGRGVGAALLGAAAQYGRANGCTRLWLVTTNDNAHAIRFYQRRGMDLAGVYLNAMDAARKLKPSIPPTGMDDIPLRHEFEFSMPL